MGGRSYGLVYGTPLRDALAREDDSNTDSNDAPPEAPPTAPTAAPP